MLFLEWVFVDSTLDRANSANTSLTGTGVYCYISWCSCLISAEVAKERQKNRPTPHIAPSPLKSTPTRQSRKEKVGKLTL